MSSLQDSGFHVIPGPRAHARGYNLSPLSWLRPVATVVAETANSQLTSDLRSLTPETAP